MVPAAGRWLQPSPCHQLFGLAWGRGSGVPGMERSRAGRARRKDAVNMGGEIIKGRFSSPRGRTAAPRAARSTAHWGRGDSAQRASWDRFGVGIALVLGSIRKMLVSVQGSSLPVPPCTKEGSPEGTVLPWPGSPGDQMGPLPGARLAQGLPGTPSQEERGGPKPPIPLPEEGANAPLRLRRAWQGEAPCLGPWLGTPSSVVVPGGDGRGHLPHHPHPWAGACALGSPAASRGRCPRPGAVEVGAREAARPGGCGAERNLVFRAGLCQLGKQHGVGDGPPPSLQPVHAS